LAARYGDRLGTDVELNFTNLTRWHDPDTLAPGITEYPFITAAGLSVLER